MAAFLAMSASAQEIEFFTPAIVHVVKTPDGTVPDRQSLVVTAKPGKVAVSVTDKGHVRTYKSKQLTVVVDRQLQKVSFLTPDGSTLLAEGSHSLRPITEGIDKGHYQVGQTFVLDTDEPIYGLGMMQHGKMDLRGEHRKMQQSNVEDYAHFFQSIKGYGVYWDNYSPTMVSDDKVFALESQVGQCVDYYFMYGGNADGVISQMRHLSGQVPMLPLWTYGFHQSRERYKSQDELLQVLRTYRQTGVPLDGIIQDWQYWGSNYNWNAMEFINPDFGNAQGMIDEVHRQGAHLELSIWASFGPHTKPYKELADKKLLFHFNTWPQSGLPQWPPRTDYPSGVRVYDCYSEEARDIYWKHLSQLHRMGVDGWWMDSTDPDHHDYKESDLDEPCAMGSWRSVRNVFPLMTVGGVDSHQRACDSVKRPFILTRSFFAGQQRYGACTWSGDVNSSWESLRAQVPLCLHHTLCANPNVNTDIGGFFAGAYNRSWGDNSATRNPQYQELYVRWMQFGLFCPMMRSHGTDVYRELYYYGKPGEPVYDALLSAVKMRYRLLPYIYSLSRRVSTEDGSFMRALMMDFKDDKNVWDNGRQYMFGHSLLVCPVLDPLFTEEKIVKTDESTGWNAQQAGGREGGWPAVKWDAEKTYAVYLPAYTAGGKKGQWYDFWTGRLYSGGTTVEADAPLGHSPLYVRQGSIIPMGPEMQYSSQKPWDTLTLLIYPGDNASFTLYEDEGDNMNYLKGAFAETPITWNNRTRTLTIADRRGAYPGMVTTRTFVLQLPDGTSKTVTYTGKAIRTRL